MPKAGSVALTGRLKLGVAHACSVSCDRNATKGASKAPSDSHGRSGPLKTGYEVSQAHFEGWGRPHHLPVIQHQSASHSIILVVNEELLLVACEGPHGQQKLGQVVAVQSAGLRGQATWQVCVANTGHALHPTEG